MEKTINGKIYKITNKINGKLYIGQTILTIHERWLKHCSVSGCTALSSAIKKYNKTNFIIDVIDYCNNIDELNQKERFYIGKYNTIAPNGYNLRYGGENSQLSTEVKQKIAKTLSGRKRPEALRKKLSKAKQGNTSRLGTGNKVLHLDSGLVFESAEQAALQFNIASVSVRQVCSEITKSVKGHVFRYIRRK